MDISLKPRKQPLQDRAKKRVEAILEATARLLTKNGFDGLTTDAIALEAGISVASLYQYFPNKHAAVYACHQQHLSRINQRFDYYEDLEKHQLTWRELFQLISDEMFRLSENPATELALYKAMTNIPELNQSAQQHIQEISTRIGSIIKNYGSSWSIEKLSALAALITDFQSSTYLRMLKTPTQAIELRRHCNHAVTSMIARCFTA